MKKIKKLNSSFLAWVDKQSQHQCFSVWKEGVKVEDHAAAAVIVVAIVGPCCV
jgi:hypothetical protein